MLQQYAAADVRLVCEPALSIPLDMLSLQPVWNVSVRLQSGVECSISCTSTFECTSSLESGLDLVSLLALRLSLK